MIAGWELNYYFYIPRLFYADHGAITSLTMILAYSSSSLREGEGSHRTTKAKDKVRNSTRILSAHSRRNHGKRRTLNPSRKSLVYLRFLSISSYYACCNLLLSITVIHRWTLYTCTLDFSGLQLLFFQPIQSSIQSQTTQTTTMTSTVYTNYSNF